MQKCSEGGASAHAGGVQGVQEDQGQTAPPGSSHQQTGFLQIHLEPAPPQIPVITPHITAARTRPGKTQRLGEFHTHQMTFTGSRHQDESHDQHALHLCHGEN